MKSPFKFLDAYTQRDKDLFFGRDEEIKVLFEMLTKNRLSLVYGPSGVGKTSLVQCGLNNCFHPTDWLPLSIRRNENLNTSFFGALTEVVEVEGKPAPELIIQDIYTEYLRPVYLLFDQFEELLILGKEAEQAQFFSSIANILEAQLPCRIIFILREEYLAHLYRFEKIIPRLFTRRLRVEPMSRLNLREVILKSCGAYNIVFENKEQNPEQIIDNVSRGETAAALPYLQAYLDRLYQQAFKAKFRRDRKEEELPDMTFSTERIEQLGSIENVLEHFLKEKQAEIEEELERLFPEGVPENLVAQVLDAFVTDKATKRPLPFKVEAEQVIVDSASFPYLGRLSAGLRTACLQALQRNRILTDTGQTYELAHDSLAALIDQNRSDEQRLRNEVKKRIAHAYEEFKASGTYLSRRQLAGIEVVLPQLEGLLSSKVQSFIQQSYEAAEQKEAAALEAERRKRRRARRVAVVGISLAILATTGMVFAYTFWQESEVARAVITRNAYFANLNNANLLQKNGEYRQALAILDSAEQLVFDERSQNILEVRRKQVGEIDSLMQAGRKLIEAGQPGIALDAYDQAFSIGQDSIIARAREELQNQINNDYKQYLRAAERFRIANRKSMALDALEKARALKPENSKKLDSLIREISLH